jgi:large subunit ribosomal protein L35
MAKQRKAKTNRSAAKRFRVTASGRIKHKKSGMRHFMRRRSVRAKRNLRAAGYISKTHEKHIRLLIPNA